MPAHDPTQMDAPRGATAQVLALSDLGPATKTGAPLGMGEGAVNPLHQVKTRLTVCVGAVELTVGELVGAREHQVLRLDRMVDQPVDVLLEGQVVARGTLVAVDDHFGVRITELPVPLKP